MFRIIKSLLSWIIPASYKPFTMFPYPYVGQPREIEFGLGAHGFPYAECNGMRVYFPIDSSKNQVLWDYRTYLEDEGLTGEGRHTKSPHCYVTADHCPEVGDVLIDVGCSEGFFARAYVERVKHIYLFEADATWRAPVMETFGNWLDKVTFVGKCVGASSSATSVRLDEIVEGKADDVYFIKMDIEGAEREVLASSREFLMNHRVKMSCCAYHRRNDGRYLTNLLREMGFTTCYSQGWLLMFNRWGVPSLRRGMIYARNF